MKKIILNVMKNSNSRMIFTVVTAFVFILAGFLFIGNELVQNKAYILRNYENQQKVLNNELITILQQKVEAKEKESDIVSDFIKNELNGSYRWCFIAKDGELIMAKNKDYLAKLQKSGVKKDTELITFLTKQDQIISEEEVSINGSDYKIGIMSDRTNVLLEWKVKKHSTYTLMALGVICMLFYVALIGSMYFLGKRDKRLTKVEKELSHRNLCLEDMSEEYSLSDEKRAGELSNTNFKDYEDELLYSLLNKTTEQNLFPLDIMYIKFLMQDRYYKKNAFVELMAPVKKMLGKNHILIEFAKGEFVILLYRTKEAEADELREKIQEYLKKEIVQYDMKLLGQHAFLSWDLKDKVVLVFDKMKEKMQKNE